MASCGLPSNNNTLQAMLQAAVQSVQWTYSLFWQLCPQQGILIWGDGYYNGAIKTRKTVQPVEVSTEEASLQRSQQLRELYDTLSAGESNQPARRPSAALSPEDLTESEWFYLMCVSFSFPPGLGLPGKAYAKRQHVWLTGANEADSKVFTRAILAKGRRQAKDKSARVQTVVCIPLLDGVVELGTTERIPEDPKFIQQVKSFFINHNQLPHQPPKPALSEQSTSNPGRSSSNIVGFHSPTLITANIPAEPPVQANQTDEMGEDEDDEEEEEEEEDEEEDADSDSEDGTERNSRLVRAAQNRGISPSVPEPSELMQVDMSEDIRLGSPDDGSNNLDWNYHLIKEGVPTLEELTQEDTHYSQIVSAILHRQSCRWSESSSSAYLMYSPQSAFTSWSTTHHHHTATIDSTSQWLLKYILFSVPFLHCKYHNDNSPKSRDITAADPASRFRKGTPQGELSANHVLAERRRREKLNERFIILRSLVPFVTKMDKASILGDTIEYVKQLKGKIQDLEGKMTRQMEVVDQRSEGTGDPQRSVVTTTGRRVAADKRKMRIVEGSGGAKPKAVEEPPPPPSAAAGEAVQVEVSIIECDALVELQCKYREGLLLDVMQKLRGLRVEITTVKSSLNNGFFVAELRAKVKENVSGKKVSIMEVKRAMNQIIPQ